MIDTRRTRRVPGRGFREGPIGLGYSGQVSHSHGLSTWGRVASSGSSRRDFPEGAFGDTWRLGKNPGGKVFHSALGNTWQVPRAFRRRLPEEFAAGLRGHKSFSKESFGSTLGTRGAFRRKDRRVLFEGVSKGAFGEMASG